MFNKKALVKTSLFISFFAGLGLSFASAATFKMSLNTTGILETSRVSPIHFGDNENDFGGFFYFTNAYDGTDAAVTIDVGNEEDEEHTVKCTERMKGFYYNSERGERLWPLDEGTNKSWGMEDDGLIIEGGLYTVCVKGGLDKMISDCEEEANNSEEENKEEVYNTCIEEKQQAYIDDNSYYGSIEHIYQGQHYGLIAGVGYITGSTWISVDDSKLSPSFQRITQIDGKPSPVGLIYDFNGGVGLVGCKINDSTSLGNFVNKLSEGAGAAGFFAYTGEDEGRYVEVTDPSLNFDCKNIGSVGNSLLGMIVDGLVGMSSDSNLGVLGNQTNSKMQYFSSSNINNATLINYVKQRAGVLCRGKWKSNINNIGTERVVCLDGVNNVDASSSVFKGKTLIVKNGTVVVKPDSYSNEYLYDIFIERGELSIDGDEGGLFVFEDNGFKSTMDKGEFNNAVTNAMFGEGCKTYQDSCPDGEVCNCVYTGTEIAVGKLLRGNFIVDGNVTAPGDYEIEDKYFIYGKFTTKSNDNIMDVFAWECRNGLDTNGDYCPPSSYQYAPLVVIDQNYDSPLFW